MDAHIKSAKSADKLPGSSTDCADWRREESIVRPDSALDGTRRLGRAGRGRIGFVSDEETCRNFGVARLSEISQIAAISS
jgi:hypothetical protein